MKNIVVVNNPILTPLYKKAMNNDKYCIQTLSEIKTIDVLNNMQCDLALISPLVYTTLNKDSNYKILKSNLLVVEDYAGEFTLNIVPNRKKLTKLYTNTLNEFIIVCTKLVLSERFGIDVNLVRNIQDADIILTIDKNELNDFVKLDLTEYWYDTFEIPLLVGFWVCKNQDYFAELVNEINGLSDNVDKPTNLTSHSMDENDYERVGYKHWEWNDKYINILERTIDLLFYRNFAKDIADVYFAGEQVNEV